MAHKKQAFRLSAPQGETSVLLHSCCAPCSTAIIEALLEHQIEPTIYYYNPNIHPSSEYERRKTENSRFAERLGLEFVDGDYAPRDWLQKTKALKHEPERGARCLICFSIRLTQTARYASENGFRLFTTTLATSRWKDKTQIIEAGRRAANAFPGLIYWEQDWRKGGLSERKRYLTEQYDFYQQQYCGCVYSLRDTNAWRRRHGRPPVEPHWMVT